MNVLIAGFVNFLTSFPVLLIWVLGIIIAVKRAEKNPRVSRVAVFSFSSFLILSFLRSFWTALLPALFERSGLSPSLLRLMLSGTGIVFLFLNALIWCGILLAIFGWRENGGGDKGNIKDEIRNLLKDLR